MLVQPVLPEGEDIRIIVVGGKVIGAMKRKAASGKFLTNYSAGGEVENFQITPEMEEIALSAAKLFHLEYVGVDLMADKQGKWRVLEVNRACQFEGFEKATGLNVPQLTLSYLLGKNA